MSRRPAGCAGAALPYVNLLLTLLAGASLATAARLWWDPSASIPLRLLLPHEHVVLRALLTACPLVLWMLVALAHAGLASRSKRRCLLITFVCGMVLLMGAQAAGGAWLYVRVRAWLAAAAAQELPRVLRALRRLPSDPLPALLNDTLGVNQTTIDHWKIQYPELTTRVFSEDFSNMIHEMPSDVTWSLYAAAGCALLAAALQPLAALLAGMAARAGAKDDDDTILFARMEAADCVASLPRCLRPMSVAEEPRLASLGKEKASRRSLRTAPRSRGWALEPGVGWTAGGPALIKD